MIIRVVLVILVLFCMTIGGLIVNAARGAELPFVILHGYSRGPSMSLDRFGTYSSNYYRKRWASLCKGGGRYVAMAEAYDMKKPSPCK